jgi:gas vesicle protein
VTDRDVDPTVVIERGGSGTALFLLGAALGAGIALLLAPQTGEETRAAVRRTARKAKRRAREFANNGEEMVEEIVRTGKAAAEEMVETGRGAVRDLTRSGKSAARDARAALEQRLAKHRDESFDAEDNGV